MSLENRGITPDQLVSKDRLPTSSDMWVFPGQGLPLRPSMDRLRHPAAEAVINKIDKGFGITYPGGNSLFEFCAKGSRVDLMEYQQEVTFATSIGLLEIARAELGNKLPRPRVVTGLSFGLFAAMVAAGGMNPEAAAKAIQVRKQLTEEQNNREKGAMAAIKALGQPDIMKKLEELRNEININIGVVHHPFQFAVSDTAEKVHDFIERAKAIGAETTLLTDIKGAFHSRLMEEARKQFDHYLTRENSIHDAEFSVGSNKPNGGLLHTKAELQAELVDGLVDQANLINVMKYSLESGVQRAIEFSQRGLVNTFIGHIHDLPRLTVSDTASAQALEHS